MNTPLYTKTVAILTVVSGLLALLCLLLLVVALADRPEALSDPMQILSVPALRVDLLRISMLADLLGYYLLLLPLIYYLHPYLQQRTPWANLITCCGTAYVLVGALGAAIFAEVATPLLTEYLTATPERQLSIQGMYQTIVRLVYGGLWNLLEALLAGVWWLMAGYFLTVSKKALGWVTILLGACTGLDGLGNLLSYPTLAEIGLNGYLILAPLWAIWLGLVLGKNAQETCLFQATSPAASEMDTFV